MRDSPRTRRLRTDLRALEQLRAQSTILEFTHAASHRGSPESYLIRFQGKGLWRPEGTTDVLIREQHEVSVQLGAAYPRMMPELSWKTPIFHPNISSSGVVCIGGYGTHWVPSLNLDELCIMLWDMVRYQNYDVESPYNREAALWARTQQRYRLPVDPRPVRDQLAGVAPSNNQRRKPPITAAPRRVETPDVLFIDDDQQIVDAEIVETEGPDILYIE